MALNNLAGVARMASRLPEELSKAQRQGVQRSALTITRAMRQEVKQATGGDNRLSGVGKRGARIGAKYDIKGSINPTAIVRATGPAQLVEHDVRAHSIAPRRRRGKARGALRFKDGSYAARASHPGTKAKRPYEKGYLAKRDEAGQQFDKAVQQAIRRVLR